MPPLTPSVSIGMPVHNGGRHLRDALESLLSQTHDDFELVISDNASSDATPEILSEFASRDSRVRVVRQARPIKAVDNFNGLLRASSAPYFMWAADDDVWEPLFLERLTSLLEQDSGAALAFCSFSNVMPGDASAVVRRFPARPELGSANPLDRMRAFLLDDEREGKANLVYGLVRRQDLDAIGGMVDWSTSRWGCDMLTVFRLLARGHVAWDADDLFRKRLASTELPRPTGDQGLLPVPLRHLPQWHGYLLGYLRIIASDRSLDGRVRLRLVGATLAKLARCDISAAARLHRRLWRPE